MRHITSHLSVTIIIRLVTTNIYWAHFRNCKIVKVRVNCSIDIKKVNGL